MGPVDAEFRQFVDQVKAIVPIDEVVREYVPTLARSGTSLKGCCPFHNEKTPSFYVHPEMGFYHCFGCGAHGDVLKFVQELEKIDFKLALEQLARRAGLALPTFVRTDAVSDDSARRLDQLRALCQWASEFYVEQLRIHPRGALVREYLHGRGLTDAEIREYGLGYAPDGYEVLVKAGRTRGWEAETLAEAGLVSRRDDGSFYDRFRDRVIFPIADRMGQIVAFAGRLIVKREDAPKYINSSETPIFHKSRLLYGQAAAREAIREEGSAILLEGYMDWIAMHRRGLRNVLAGMGTALTEDHARMLRRITRKVILLYDADAAGQKAMVRGAELLLRQGMEVHVATLEGGHDPDTFLAEAGTQAMRDLLAAAPPALDELIRKAADTHDLARPQGKAEAVEFLAPLLLAPPDPVVREGYLGRAAASLGLRLEILEQALTRRGSNLRRAAEPAAGPPPEEADGPFESLAPDAPIDRPTQTEQNLLYILTRCLDQWSVLQAIEAGWFQNDTLRRIYETLYMMQKDVREGADPPADLFQLFQEETELHWISRILLLPMRRFGGELGDFDRHLAEALPLQIYKLKRHATTRLKQRLVQDMQLIGGESPLGQGQLAEIDRLSRENLAEFARLVDRENPSSR